MKIALIGDPHAKLNSLSDLSVINQYIISLKKEGKIQKAIFLGDLFDTHSVMRIEIWNFWKQQISLLLEHFSPEDIAIISGNHDKPGSYEKENLSAIATLNSVVLVYDAPFVWNSITLVPFYSKESDFIDACKNTQVMGSYTKYLVCHQTFNGAKYDNGMYAPDGFDYTLIPHEKIISGHIHTTMEFDKVFYPGTARWESASDANKEKGIYVLDTNTDTYDFYPTNGIVMPMYSIEIKENEEIPELLENAKYAIHLIGTSKWISKIKPKFKNMKVKTTYTDSLLKRSAYKHENFADYLDKIELSVKKEDILKLIGEL